MPTTEQTSQPLPRVLAAVAALVFCLPFSGCVAVGYTSGGGWFVFPGLGVILLILLVFFLLRGRR